MEYKISVIMPVYNAARFLQEAMNSLIAQTIGFENLQVIMVDDCSTDESPKMMADYADQYSNVEVYKTRINSGGAGQPRNTGLEHVCAPYVMFLDPDDYYDANACNALYRKITKHNVEIAGGYFSLVDVSGNVLSHVKKLDEERCFNCPEEILDALKAEHGCWSMIYNVGFLNKNRMCFLSQGFGEDTAFLCKCFANSCKYLYVPARILHYRQNDESATHVRTETYFEKNLLSMTAVKRILQPFPEAWQWKVEQLSAYYFNQSLLAEQLTATELARVYENCSTLFIRPKGNMSEEIDFALELIGNGEYEQAAKFALIVRKMQEIHVELPGIIQNYENLLRRHEERQSARFADAVNEHRYGDAIRVFIEMIKSRFNTK